MGSDAGQGERKASQTISEAMKAFAIVSVRGNPAGIFQLSASAREKRYTALYATACSARGGRAIVTTQVFLLIRRSGRHRDAELFSASIAKLAQAQVGSGRKTGVNGCITGVRAQRSYCAGLAAICEYLNVGEGDRNPFGPL